MFKAKTHRTVASLVVGLACIAAPSVASAASPVILSGAITGVVSDNLGIPQMGATVLLYNRLDRSLAKVQTDSRGEFKFAGLFPELYSIRVSLATFLPAFKRDIQVQAGMRSVLHVSLSTLLSTIQLSYPTALESGSIMSDDWKWVLRSATATRPVLRLIEPKPGTPVDAAQRAAVFSDTRGLLKVSAGEGSIASGIATEADMGTAFALATSLYGNNQLQVSGNVGYGSQTGAPSAAFRTSYSRSVAGTTPEVSLTMRQMFLPARLSAALAGNDAALPMLRTMSASFDDSAEIADNVTLRYGSTIDTVTFLDHLSYFSPYAQMTIGSGDTGKIQLTYTSGNARPDLGGPDTVEADLQQGLNTLGMFPRVSLRGGRPKIQRGEEYEIAFSRKLGSRTYSVSAYHEMVRNATLSMVAPQGMYEGGDVLPDLFSGNSIFNIGDHQNSGFSAAVTQSLGEHLSTTLTYGSEGGLTADHRELVSNSPDELRSMIRSGRKHAATARVNLTAPRAGTRLIASYQWSDQRWAMSGNLYSTQPGRQLPGLNLYIRQPLPRVGIFPWRMEATADIRNMLAQGYLPLMTAGGQRVLLVETPRSFRGGLSFIF
jgi:hypothetical protein